MENNLPAQDKPEYQTIEIFSEILEENLELFNLLDSPWQLIKKGGSLGIKGIGRLFLIISIFSISNILLFLFLPLVRMLMADYQSMNLLFLLVTLLVGILFTLFAGFKAYRFVMLDAVRVIYENSGPFFLKLYALVVDKVEDKIKGKVDLSKPGIQKIVNYSQLIDEKYKKAPSLLKRGLLVILNRIPLYDVILEFKDDIIAGEKDTVVIKIYKRIDFFIQDNIFGENNTNWVYWVLPLNWIIVILMSIFLIK